MMFDGPHLLYIFISLTLTVFMIYVATRYIKKQKMKDLFLKFFAALTVFLHLLPLWVDFLSGQPAIANDNMLFPIYFCNLTMYLLVITAFWGDKNSKAFKYLATMTSYAGIFGALISLFYPEYYFAAGTMFTVGVMKSMLSHSTMLVGSLYLLTAGYFKINLKQNVIVYSVGLLAYGLIGMLVNLTFRLANLNSPNAMYLIKPPIDGVNVLNAYTIALMMIGLVALISYLIEFFKKKQTLKISDEVIAN